MDKNLIKVSNEITFKLSYPENYREMDQYTLTTEVKVLKNDKEILSFNVGFGDPKLIKVIKGETKHVHSKTEEYYYFFHQNTYPHYYEVIPIGFDLAAHTEFVNGKMLYFINEV